MLRISSGSYSQTVIAVLICHDIGIEIDTSYDPDCDNLFLLWLVEGLTTQRISRAVRHD